MKRKTTKELIAEDSWLMSLKPLPRTIVGSLKYRFKEILSIILVLVVSAWVLTAFQCQNGKVSVIPGIEVRYKNEGVK